MCIDTYHNEQVNDIVYRKMKYNYVTYIPDENGDYNPIDKTKIRFTHGIITLDPIDIDNFIPCKQVTYEILLDWIKARINETELQNLHIQKFDTEI
jgi:hypothetical protein